jgi:plasmid rolling circle replication initiator protein Rep
VISFTKQLDDEKSRGGVNCFSCVRNNSIADRKLFSFYLSNFCGLLRKQKAKIRAYDNFIITLHSAPKKKLRKSEENHKFSALNECAKAESSAKKRFLMRFC